METSKPSLAGFIAGDPRRVRLRSDANVIPADELNAEHEGFGRFSLLSADERKCLCEWSEEPSDFVAQD
jgi:hypothetical protein